jgi:hypothetical protein
MDVARTYTTYAISAAAAYAIYRAVTYIFNPTPLKDIPGPPNPSILLGNFRALAAVGGTEGTFYLLEKWVADHGRTIGFRHLFNVRLCSSPIT